MKATKQQTAVEWLVEKLDQNFDYVADTIIEQAKEMEKKQIVEAVNYGQNNHTVSITSDREIAEQYYNETYGKKK